MSFTLIQCTQAEGFLVVPGFFWYTWRVDKRKAHRQIFTIFTRNSMIGIFDSGIGGMTVAQAVEQLLPEHPILYLGDIARAPYGPKSARTITAYAEENTAFLVDKGAQVVVIACNSASSVATEHLRQKFRVPIIEVISPAVEQVLQLTRSGRIGIIGTRATINSGVYERKITAANPACKVISQACPLLVPLVEEGWINKRETKMILRRYLHSLKDQQVDTLVLGCTHYPLLKHLIQPRIGKKVRLIDSSAATAAYLKTFLEKEGIPQATPRHEITANRYFVTDITDSACLVAEKIFGRPINLILT